MTTLNQSAGTLGPLRLSGIAAPERENPGRDLHVFTLSPTLLVDLLHSWKPEIPTVTMLPPQPVSFGHVRIDTGCVRPRASLAARTRPAPPPPSVRGGPPSPGPSPATVRPLQWRALWCPPGLLWRPGPPPAGPPRAIQVRGSPPHKATRAPRHPSQRGASRPVSEDKLQAW